MNEDAPQPAEPPVEPWPKASGRWLAPLLVCVIACVLLALFYAVENWRGKRAWQKTKAEFAARQESLDWASFLPQKPPDELNLMKAPGMEDLFIRGRNSNVVIPALSRRGGSTNDIRYGLVQFVNKAEAQQLPAGTRVFDFERLKTDPRLAQEISRVFAGQMLSTPNGAFVSERKPGDDVKLVYIQAEQMPAMKELSAALAAKDSGLLLAAPRSVIPSGSNTVALVANPYWFGAAELVDMTAGAANIFATVHEAVQRPRCSLPGDYSVPHAIPMPNFVHARMLAQLRGARAQAFILLNRPDEAMEEINGLDEINRIMLTEPPTLVSAMIRVAISGLKVERIKEGFVADIWRQEHWRQFQEANSKINLVPQVLESMRGPERAGVCSLMETDPVGGLPRLYGINATAGDAKAETLMFRIIPRGWIYQNTVVYAQLMQASIDATDLSKPFLDPIQTQEAADQVMASIERRSPMTVLARIAIPNFRKAAQGAIKHQTWIHQVIVASALERYRKDSGNYPETLDELVPKFMDKVPIDLILGKPLRYQKRANDEYALYSLGWNAVDDTARALASPQAAMHDIFATKEHDADWVWEGIRQKPEIRGGAGAPK